MARRQHRDGEEWGVLLSLLENATEGVATKGLALLTNRVREGSWLLIMRQIQTEVLLIGEQLATEAEKTREKHANPQQSSSVPKNPLALASCMEFPALETAGAPSKSFAKKRIVPRKIAPVRVGEAADGPKFGERPSSEDAEHRAISPQPAQSVWARPQISLVRRQREDVANQLEEIVHPLTSRQEEILASLGVIIGNAESGILASKEPSCSPSDTLLGRLHFLMMTHSLQGNLQMRSSCRMPSVLGLITEKGRRIFASRAVLLISQSSNVLSYLPERIYSGIQLLFPGLPPKNTKIDLSTPSSGGDSVVEHAGWSLSPPKYVPPPARLRPNLEIAWDALQRMFAKFMGNHRGVRPGTIAQEDLRQLREGLHSANFDAFAARTLDMLSLKCDNKDNALERRLTEAAGSSKGKQKTGGVVLHRIPEVVQEQFSQSQAELFFFSLFESLDSARLNVALASRLFKALAEEDKLIRQETYMSARAMKRAIGRARLAARFLAQANHMAGWPNSSAVIEGESKSKDPLYPLHQDSLAGREVVVRPTWEHQFDLQAILRESLHYHRLLGTLSWCLPMLIIASTDPVAKSSTWLRNPLQFLAGVRQAFLACMSDSSRKATMGQEYLLCVMLIEQAFFTIEIDLDLFEAVDVVAVDSESHFTGVMSDFAFIGTLIPDLVVLDGLLVRANNGLIPQNRILRGVQPRKVTANAGKDSDGGISKTNPSLHSVLLSEMFERENPNFLELVRMAASSAADDKSSSDEAASKKAQDLVLHSVGPLLGPSVSQSKIRVASHYAADLTLQARLGARR